MTGWIYFSWIIYWIYQNTTFIHCLTIVCIHGVTNLRVITHFGGVNTFGGVTNFRGGQKWKSIIYAYFSLVTGRLWKRPQWTFSTIPPPGFELYISFYSSKQLAGEFIFWRGNSVSGRGNLFCHIAGGGKVEKCRQNLFISTFYISMNIA